MSYKQGSINKLLLGVKSVSLDKINTYFLESLLKSFVDPDSLQVEEIKIFKGEGQNITEEGNFVLNLLVARQLNFAEGKYAIVSEKFSVDREKENKVIIFSLLTCLIRGDCSIATFQDPPKFALTYSNFNTKDQALECLAEMKGMVNINKVMKVIIKSMRISQMRNILTNRLILGSAGMRSYRALMHALGKFKDTLEDDTVKKLNKMDDDLFKVTSKFPLVLHPVIFTRTQSALKLLNWLFGQQSSKDKRTLVIEEFKDKLLLSKHYKYEEVKIDSFQGALIKFITEINETIKKANERIDEEVIENYNADESDDVKELVQESERKGKQEPEFKMA